MDRIQQHTSARHLPDADTVAGADSTELRHRIEHSPLPVETAITEVFRQSTAAFEHASRKGHDDAPPAPERLAVIHPLPEPQEASDEVRAARLQDCQQRYHTEDKHPSYDEHDLLAFARASQAHRLHPDQAAPAELVRLWSRLQIERLPYDRRSGDNMSAQIYIGLGHLGPALIAIPALMTLCSSDQSLQSEAQRKSLESLLVQLVMVPVSALLQASVRVMGLPLMENVRQGSPMRSKEMKTRNLPTLVAEMKRLCGAMDGLSARMKKEHDDLQAAAAREAPDLARFVERADSASADMATLAQEVGDVLEEYAARKNTDGLNDVFTTWRTRVGMLQVGANFVSGVVATATGKPKLGAGIQLAGTGAAALWNQGLSAPWHALSGSGEAPTRLVGAAVSDDALKQDATIEATALSTNILKPAARAKQPEDITLDDLDLSDFRKQWKGPIGVAVSQVEEILAFNIRIKDQKIDELLGLEPGESKKLEALAARPEAERSEADNERLADLRERCRLPVPESDQDAHYTALKEQRAELQRQKAIVNGGEDWAGLAPETRNMLHDALAERSPLASLRHTFRLGLVRMAQPSDFIPQVVQLLGGAMQMYMLAGRSFPLLMQAAFRMAGAENVEQGKPSPVPKEVRYGVSVFAALVGIWGVLSASPLIREKIAQRGEMRARAAEHGEKFGVAQNFTPANLQRAGANLVRAMQISVADPVRQRRAAKTVDELKTAAVGADGIFDQLAEELERQRLG